MNEAEAVALAVKRVVKDARAEIDLAYRRGYEDGQASGGPGLLVLAIGAVSGVAVASVVFALVTL